MKKSLLDSRDLERHATRCTICKHPQLDEIEREFVSWTSVPEIVKEFSIPERSSVYRHARAAGLFEKRDRNIKLALGKIVERAGEIMPNANAIVAAAVALAKINADGRYVERREVLSLTPSSNACQLRNSKRTLLLVTCRRGHSRSSMRPR
jgi:hypothetical protein